jgi:FlaA1/EpsC-like NDP-sugar epimerase
MKTFRSVLLFALDLFIIIMMYIFAALIRFDFAPVSYQYALRVVYFIPIIISIYAVVFISFNIHKTLWSSSGLYEFMTVTFAVILSGIILWSLGTLIDFNILVLAFNRLFRLIDFDLSLSSVFLPTGIHLIGMMLTILGLNAARFSFSLYRLTVLRSQRHPDYPRTIIYGAGDAGQLLYKEVLNNSLIHYEIVGFLDDDPYKHSTYITGLKVYGGQQHIEQTIKDLKVDVVIVAMPSANHEARKKIIQKAFSTGVEVLSLQGAAELITKGDMIKSVAKISINDVLGRTEVKLNNILIKSVVHNKVVLVTGAAGSIGSELVRQIIQLKPKRIIAIDIHENGLYDLEQFLKIQHKDLLAEVEFSPVIASVRDQDNLDSIFANSNIDVVFHAAAHKHVPLMETAYLEAMKNNVLGSYKLFSSAKKYHVPLVVTISTDKAVNPTNIMGASKRLVEMLAQAMTLNSKTKYVCVRFGNVLGSNGSVIPLFTKQIEAGGPITVTHPDMIRYFMSIPEAVSLVLQASSYGDGGEIFVLDMGEPVKILQLAKNMIRLAGLSEEDIKIEFSGLRPGEKLYEELLLADEGLKETSNELIYVAKPMDIDPHLIFEYVTKLESLIEKRVTKQELIHELEQMIPTFKHQEND